MDTQARGPEDLPGRGAREVTVDCAGIIAAHVQTSDVPLGRIHVEAPEAFIIESYSPRGPRRHVHSHLVWQAG
jgi:hypothetical protein